MRRTPLVVAAAGFASLIGVWADTSAAGIAVRLAIVLLACAVLLGRSSAPARDRLLSGVAFAAACLIAAGARLGGRRLPHSLALGVCLAALAAAVALSLRPGRPRRRWSWRRWLLVVPVALFVVLPLTAETYVLATDRPPATVPADLPGTFVQTGNVRTHVEQWGTAGQPLVLVPGFLESTYVWESSAPLLARDHRVVAYDVRGFGWTERGGPFTLDGDVAQLDALLRVLHLDGVDRPVLVGHSSGAAIITAFARLHPDRVAGIVLVDGDATPYGAGPAFAHTVITEPLFTAGLRLGLGSDAVIRAVLHRQCGATCTIEPERWRAPFRQPKAEDALLRILRRPLIGLEPAQIEQVRVPAAVLSGALDDTMLPADVATTGALLHTSDTAVLTGEHHLAMLHDPATFAATVERLLSRLPAAPTG
jgi:pimeloyl-ACP methyl ester carboxylesterase